MKHRTQRREIKKSLGTPQGRRTLLVILIGTIFAMVLNWIIPIIILKINPNTPPAAAEEIGVFAAFGVAFIYLMVSLLKGQVNQRRQPPEQGSDTQNSVREHPPQQGD